MAVFADAARAERRSPPERKQTMSWRTLPRRIICAASVVLLSMPVLAQAQTALRVPVVSRTLFYLPAWTAEKQGSFKEAGLDVTI